jgi:hypothetical protein
MGVIIPAPTAGCGYPEQIGGALALTPVAWIHSGNSFKKFMAMKKTMPDCQWDDCVRTRAYDAGLFAALKAAYFLF